MAGRSGCKRSTRSKSLGSADVDFHRGLSTVMLGVGLGFGKP